MLYRWGYTADEGNRRCIPDTNIYYSIKQSDRKEAKDLIDPRWTKHTKQKLPWALKIVYALNLATAKMFNVTSWLYYGLGLVNPN